MRTLILSFLIIFIAFSSHSEELVCMSKEDAVRVVETIKKCQIDRQILSEQEALIDNLKQQNELLRRQVEILKESLKLQENQAELYRIAYEEEKKKERWSWLSKGMYFGIGIVLGFVTGAIIY